MGNERMRQYSQVGKPKYDSDEDLSEDTRKKISESSLNKAEEIRNDAWDQAGAYPKLKRMVKGAWAGDKRKPQK